MIASYFHLLSPTERTTLVRSLQGIRLSLTPKYKSKHMPKSIPSHLHFSTPEHETLYRSLPSSLKALITPVPKGSLKA